MVVSVAPKAPWATETPGGGTANTSPPLLSTGRQPPNLKAESRTGRVEVRVKWLASEILQEENLSIRLSPRTEAGHKVRPAPASDSSSEEEFMSISGSDSPSTRGSSKEALLSDKEEGAPGPDDQAATRIA